MCFREYPFKGNYASEIKLMEIMKRDCIVFPKVCYHPLIGSEWIIDLPVVKVGDSIDDAIQGGGPN